MNFSKTECLISNEKGEVLMRGARSKHNFYLRFPEEEANLSTYLVSKEEEVNICGTRNLVI